MSSQKLEYDASLGGHVTLPSHVATYHYASGVLQEIKSMIADAQFPASSKLIFQTLPKHMRRRAMSHHPKRLPRKYRAAHSSQMSKAGNQPVNRKRPSRKYRRRPKNLLNEYIRRQRKINWLETHIWHAKRFHMIDRWGYRLPYASCDKTYRACYRASAEHCLLQDISFYSCVQMLGTVDQLRHGFGRLTSPDCGLGIAARTYLSGRREGTIQLFADGQYPAGALQSASFMWRPAEQPETQAQRTLWLWLHPAAVEATLAQLIQVFQLKSTKQEKLPLPAESDDQAPRFVTHTKAFERNRSYINKDTGMEMLVLDQEFNRFRLTGPRSQCVLAASLRASRQNSSESSTSKKLLDAPSDLLDQADYCEAALQLHSPSEVLSNVILGVNVVDPRLQRPSKRTKATKLSSSVGKSVELLMMPPASPPFSDLWDPELRVRLSEQMMSTHQYNQLRQRHAIVPGEPCAFEEQMQPLPLLLIQRPGSQQPNYKRLGYAAGWDVIAPARYGMVLWQTLIMWSARPGGLREFDSVARELGVDQHLPDTVAGLEQAARTALERRTRYFRLPPNKRCNYRKLAVVSPFKAPWQSLVRDWNLSPATPAKSFYVMRNRALLQRLDGCVRHREPFPDCPTDNCLVQVALRLHTRGSLESNALICLPSSLDWKRHWRQLKQDNQEPVHTEPLLSDVNERLRKQLRLDHKRLLKRLRARRVREKRRLQETSTRRVHIRPAKTASLVSNQSAKMCSLWLPTDPAETHDSVRRQCSREVFGYVSSAGFSFVEAAVCGVGYVTVHGLRQLLQERKADPIRAKGQPLLCLVRNADSRDYRFARLQINLDLCAAV
ncbi:PREDICTED: ribonucleases P/MRP protein subunit POP1 [Drosophila arizonae]|uniref:Ribonucleases P/MRP protein subunit POP1 n=1 Tax=Drosophila arizonae TaxID=7263 RepID=A0ABM1PTC9_DROAR|nr:PREDICTED: ribonucleases P/MRP protein subunit POP1 [Drosophila arizonae]